MLVVVAGWPGPGRPAGSQSGLPCPSSPVFNGLFAVPWQLVSVRLRYLMLIAFFANMMKCFQTLLKID